MRNYLFLIVCIVISFQDAFCQSDSSAKEFTDKEVDSIILEIRKRYEEVKKIETDEAFRSNQDIYDHDYHVTKINWADTTEGFPGVGTKYSYFEFHSLHNRRVKLVHKHTVAEYGVYKEYIYDKNAELIFYYERNGAGAESYEERIYYYQSKLIHYQIKSNDFPNDEKVKDFRLKNLTDSHYSRASDARGDSKWRIDWFDDSQHGLDVVHEILGE